ncbi:MAG: PadR family transcriptional regulator [Nocardioidaceae bacterium]|nr:PadR family transcriptional regulator [Nocardioidaceae bacterium]
MVLGAVCLFEPVNGYQIRRELLSWDVEEWAHINPGSIYSALATLTKQAHVVRHDLVDGTREVAVYTSTERGRAELADLFARALETVEELHPLAFHTALSMASMFERDTVAKHLRVRAARLEEHLARLEEKRGATASGQAPPHVARLLELQIAEAREEQRWIARFAAEVDAGEHSFQGEPAGWRPAPDDPGWQMAHDRERYLALLAAR